MKILHTSDLHIGKRLMGKERLDEQAQVLDEIISICDREEVDLVLIAGDIFDTYTPSAEAEELFYQKIKGVAGEKRAVLLISGNHDDGVRLSAAAPLAQEYGIYIVGNERRILGKSATDRKAYPAKYGKGYAVFQSTKEEEDKAFICLLPYPNEARFREEKSELPYVEQMTKWIAEGNEQNTENLPSVLLAHIFVAGGSVSDGEREIDLGGARALPLDGLPACDYIALGHLHKKQHMGKGHCYYSGSPLQYSFDEVADKGVKVFDLTKNGVENLVDIPLTAGKKLVRVEANGVEDATELLEKYPDAHIELTLHLTEPLSGAQAKALTAHANLVSLLTELQTDGQMEFQSRKGLSDEKLFDAFYRSQYGEEPKGELKELFLQTMSEIYER